MASDKPPARSQIDVPLLGLGVFHTFMRAHRQVAPAPQVAHDTMTGQERLPAASFVTLIRREVRRAARMQSDLSIALFKLDGKATRSADEVAACVRRSLRETDKFAVLGDGVIAVLLPDTNLDGASIYARRIMSAICVPGVTAETHPYPSPAFDDLGAQEGP
ncbi:MAG: hypothetical protein U1F54_16115 [Burkholderiales bacterium]